jgi:hypothetical protein
MCYVTQRKALPGSVWSLCWANIVPVFKFQKKTSPLSKELATIMPSQRGVSNSLAHMLIPSHSDDNELEELTNSL